MRILAVIAVLTVATGCRGTTLRSPVERAEFQNPIVAGEAPPSACGKPVYKPVAPHIDDNTTIKCENGNCFIVPKSAVPNPCSAPTMPISAPTGSGIGSWLAIAAAVLLLVLFLRAR